MQATSPNDEPMFATELTLWRRCGVIFGAWRADGTGLFVAHPGQALSQSCVPTTTTRPAPPA